MLKNLKELQKNLKLKKESHEKKNFKELDNLMKNINKDLLKTAKKVIKLILRDYPYEGYKNEYNDEYLDKIFDKGKEEIKKFINNKLKIKYNLNKINKNLEKEKYLIVQKITSHLNNIIDNIKINKLIF